MLFLFSDALVNAQCLKPSEPSDISIGEIKPASFLNEVGVDTTQIDSVKAALLDSNDYISGEAALFLAKLGDKQLISPILRRFNQVKRYDAGSENFITALNRLGYQNITSLAKPFADSLYKKILEGTYVIGGTTAYVEVVDLLFENKNYSHLDKIKNLIEREADFVKADTNYLYELDTLVKIKRFHKDIIDELVYVVNNYKDPEARLSSINLMIDFPDSKDLSEELRKVAVNDPATKVRLEAIWVLRYRFFELNITPLVIQKKALQNPVSP